MHGTASGRGRGRGALRQGSTPVPAGRPVRPPLFTMGHNPLRRGARQRLRATLAAHDTGRGVFFEARTWIITARRP